MVASLLRLRLLSLGNRIARPRSAAEGVAVALAGIAVVLVLVALGGFAAAVGEATPELRGTAFVVLGSAVVAGFWLLPFAFRVDDGMPPRAFASFELPPGRLAAGLALTRLLSIPVLLLVVLLVVQAGSWRAEGAAAVWTAIAADVVILALCVLGSQVASSIAGRTIVWRNLAGVLALAAVAVAAPLAAVLGTIDWSAAGVTYLRRAAAVLEWTPFGVAWGAPAAAAAGDPGGAWGRIGLGLAIALVLAAIWAWIVRRSGRTLPRAEMVQRFTGLGIFEAAPPVPGGVVAARSVVYWMRDSRYAVPLLILPLVPIVIALAFWLAGIPDGVVAWLCVPLMTLLIGWSVHNDIAADGTAFWLHVVTGIGGRADRWGRIVPLLLIGGAVVVLGSLITVWILGEPAILLPLAALSTCTLLVALGVGSVASAVWPYPTVAPGDGPFAQPQAMLGGEPAKQTLSIVLTVLLCAPAVAVVLAGLLVDPALLGVAVWVAFGSGVLVLVGGIEIGALVVSRRAPEILAFTQQN